VAKFYQHLRSTRIKTGVWTVVILLIMLFGYLWLTNRISMKKQQVLQVVFSDVMGLETGDKIMFRGMEAGRVKSVQLHKDGILVSGKISRNIRIPAGSRFYIEDSLMGSKSLNIMPVKADNYLDLAYQQRGEKPTSMMAMIAQAGQMLNKLDKILADIDADGGLLDLGQSLLRNSNATVRSAKHSLEELKTELSGVICKVDSLTLQANKLVSESSEPLQNTLAMAPETMNRVNSTLDSLRALSTNLNRQAQALSEGSGSAGKLLSEDELYEKLLESIKNLDALIGDIKKNPRKYIKFSLF
jgi:phospholipid/cholesterol/gamma-HCH transport system substrate-binding protein